MKNILFPLTLLLSPAVFSQQAPLEKHVYDNIHHEKQLKPSAKIPTQASFALADNSDNKNYGNKSYGLTPKYWLTLSYPNLKMIDPFPAELEAMFHMPNHEKGVNNIDNKSGIFLLHHPAMKKNTAELMFPY